MMQTKACIFDLDGVITDTAHHHYESWKYIAEKLNFELTPAHNEQLKGVSRADSLDKICNWANASLPAEERHAWLDEKNAVYLSRIAELTDSDILPGVTEFLDHLETRNILLAIGSSSKNAPFILEKLGLINRFEVISDGNSVTHSKPAPDVFLNAAAELGVTPEHCIVFEDAASGIQAALAAGMTAVGLGDVNELASAHLIFSSLEGLTLDQIVRELT
jgi:beta-phosphoglucomutase